jgi:hypothetical protein
VSISAPLGGFVKSTDLLQGMHVNKGQVVVVMEHPDYIQLQQDYLENKNQLEFLDQEYQRQLALSKENVNALKAVQQSKAAYLGTLAKVEGLRAKLKLININPKDIESGAIVNFNAKHFVFIEKDAAQHRFQLFEVKTGASDGDFIEVDAELNDFKDKVVVSGAFELLNVLKNVEE